MSRFVCLLAYPASPHNCIHLISGPGRAGKFGELSGETGGQYQGEILAGRPHGHGYYFMKKVAPAQCLNYILSGFASAMLDAIQAPSFEVRILYMFHYKFHH